MNVIKVLCLLFIFASCDFNLFKSKDESLINHVLKKEENLDITVIHKNKKLSFVKKGRKILFRSSVVYPVSYEKFEDWFSDIDGIYFSSKLEKQPKTFGQISSFRINTETNTTQVFFAPLVGEPSKVFVRVRSNDKTTRKNKTRMGVIDKSELDKFLVDPQSLRKTQYMLPMQFSQGFYYVNEKEYLLTANERNKIGSLFSSFESDTYVHSGKITDATANLLKLGNSENEGLKGVFFLESNNSVYVFYTFRPSPDRMRLWIRGDFEVLEGNFSKWDDLKQIESKILSL